MKKMNFINKIAMIAGAAVVMAFSACADWEDINDDPGRPGTDDMGVEAGMILFPEIIDLMHNWQENRSQMIDQMVFNQYGGYMLTTNRWGGNNFGTFNPSVDWQDDTWNEAMSRFYVNFDQIKKSSGGTGYMVAWANIIRAAVMLRVVDTYGPMPYSKVDINLDTWEYDSVKDVYHNMIADLTAAIPVLEQFVASLGGATPMAAPYDKVYGGDFTKWIKFANSLKLRMAVRIGLVDTDYAKGVMAEAIAGGCILDNADNALIPTTDNPYLKASVEWNDLGSNATLSTYLSGWNDPRRTVYLTGGGTGNRGVRPGIAYAGEGDKTTYSNAANYAKPNFTADSPMLVFCAAETCFLMAEAAQRGWISGNAQTYYEQGISTSMAQHNVSIGNYMTATMTNAQATYTDPLNPDNSFDNLITAAGNTPLAVSWTAQTTDEMKIEAIVTQKWLANYTLGAEGWADFRRTGYPRMIPARDNLSAQGTGGMVSNPMDNLITTNAVRMVRRIPYPVSERNNNPINMQAAIDNMLSGPDELSTELWWAKGKQQ